jgi:flagellar capping protein FliD
MYTAYQKNAAEVAVLNQNSSAFVSNYTSSMNSLDSAAEKLRNGGMTRMLYDSSGEVTDATVSTTVDAVKKMVEQYNATLKVLNDNADRGSGVKRQLARMVTVDPAPAASMEKVGISVNDDGTLKLDAEKLTTALKDGEPYQRNLLTDIIGGQNGIADKIHVNAGYGKNLSAFQLVGNDVSKVKDLQKDNPFYEMYKAIKGHAYALNDMAYTGMFFSKTV